MGCRDVKVLTEQEWRDAHAGHGAPDEGPAAVQPPAGYRLWQLRCPCGAVHTVARDRDDDGEGVRWSLRL